MDISKITEEKLNGLKILAMKGADNATLAISRWIAEKVDIKIFDVHVFPINEVVKSVGNPEKQVVAILSHLEGGITGYMLFMFSNETALKLANKVLKKNCLEESFEWDTLTVSTMEETANIVGSAFVNELVAFLDVPITLCSPGLAIDYASAIIECVIIEDAMVSDYVLFFETKFCDKNTCMEGSLLLLPNPESVSFLIDKIS